MRRADPCRRPDLPLLREQRGGELITPTPELRFRTATGADLEAIVGLLADDALGAKRERFTSPLPDSYRQAFEAIERDPNNELLVACAGEEVVGTLQLTFTPSLSYQGSWRATIESVRTAAALRGRGIGSALVRHAIDRASERGCRIVQLSTDRSRSDAKRFYERLGFVATHDGMKLHTLAPPSPAANMDP